jgi:hypothetical protein
MSNRNAYRASLPLTGDAFIKQYRLLMDNNKLFMEWFAVRTRSNRESVVADALEGKGFEVWCPRYKAPPFRAGGVL